MSQRLMVFRMRTLHRNAPSHFLLSQLVPKGLLGDLTFLAATKAELSRRTLGFGRPGFSLLQALGFGLWPPGWALALFTNVGWMKVSDQTILALANRVVTHNARVSVSHDTQRTWQLHIRQTNFALAFAAAAAATAGAAAARRKYCSLVEGIGQWSSDSEEKENERGGKCISRYKRTIESYESTISTLQ
ncbi:hypothetical protein FOCC_FOCC007819 [Frankliniella occidentalis]|nr:hypothetical protein FOCC_FOCC007819 [Frankliniella occidentalis]